MELRESTPRITSGYCEGSGKKKPGYSEILKGEQLPKSDPACKLQSLGWKVAILSARCVAEMPIPDAEASHFLTWINSNFFSLGAYAFNKGNTDHRVFPTNCVQQLEAEVQRMKTFITRETGRAATDFIRLKSSYGLLVEETQLTVRETEAEFVSWMYDIRIVSDFYSHLDKDSESAFVRYKRMRTLGDFLNRLSTYLFWMNQYHALLFQIAEGLPFEYAEWKSNIEVGLLFPE
jgi:cob(I)alamin adenosyltransferase